MINALAAAKPPLSAREAGERCRCLSYPNATDGGKKLEAYCWTTPRYVSLLTPKWPQGYDWKNRSKCTGDYIGKDGDSQGEHHLHADNVASPTHMVCCLCGWQWKSVSRDIEHNLSVLLTCFVAKLLEDELGF